MSATHTIYPGYSGPFEVDFTPILDVAIDVFGLGEVVIRQGTPLYPAALVQAPKVLEFELEGAATGWQVLEGPWPAGRYRWTYLSGAFQADTLWNQGYLGPYAGDDPLLASTLRPWLMLGDETAFFPFGFEPEGFLDAATAAAAAQGARHDIWHPGGPVQAAWDIMSPGAGSVTFRLQHVPEPSGVGFWSVPWSSLPDKASWPAVVDPLAATPKIRGIAPGLHLIRFTSVDIDGKVRWQNFYIWSWQTPPREVATTGEYFRSNSFERDKFRRDRFSTIKAQVPAPWELFPVRLPKQLGGVLPYDTYIRQPPPTSGNHPERPDRVAELPKEKGREGAAEDY